MEFKFVNFLISDDIQALTLAGVALCRLLLWPAFREARDWLCITLADNLDKKRHISQLYFIPEVYGGGINMDKAEMNSSSDGKY
jgi:hypothetical protein